MDTPNTTTTGEAHNSQPPQLVTPNTITKGNPLYDVYLDGVRQERVTYADRINGIVRKYQTTRHGSLISIRGSLQQVTLYGNVEFKLL